MSDYAAEELEEAHDALSDAAVLRDDGTDKALVNRLYYACFHAAQAVLYTKGFEPGSHRAVVSLFGQEVVLDDEASKDDGRFLNELRDLREQADYDHEPIEADTEALFARTDAFVTDMEALCE